MKKYNQIKESFTKDVFMKYEDTDLNGPGCEMAIDLLIDEYNDLIRKQIPKTDQPLVRQAVKKLWLEKLNNWKKV
jgi:hypothetical protein